MTAIGHDTLGARKTLTAAGKSYESGDDACDEDEIATVVATNVTGTILGTRAAILQFLTQKEEEGNGGGGGR